MASDDSQPDLLSPLGDVDLMQLLLADLHDDLPGKVARFRQLVDLSEALGSSGTMLFGGELTNAAWTEARSSFVHGNFVATVLVCQSLVEHLLAAFLHGGLMVGDLPPRIAFAETIRRCEERRVITSQDAQDLRRLMALRNPYSHFRSPDDSSNLSRRALDTRVAVDHHLFRDASFAMGMAIRVLALPAFRLGKPVAHP